MTSLPICLASVNAVLATTDGRHNISDIKIHDSHLKHAVGCVDENRVVDLFEDQHGAHLMSL